MLTTELLDEANIFCLENYNDCVYEEDEGNCYKKLKIYYLTNTDDVNSIDRLCKKHIKLANKDHTAIVELTLKDITYLRITGKYNG